MSVAIDVVIVSYRCADLLRECLQSLREGANGASAISVCVVDNASGDGTVEVVTREFPEAELIKNSSNRGFAAASNQGIRAGSAPLVLILNPDARLEPGTLAALREVLDANPEVAMVGPKLIRADGSLDHAARRSFPSVRSALAYFTGLQRLVPPAERYTAPNVSEGSVDAINGAFMLIHREALELVGLFDEGYWMYMEDLDLCYRFWQRGLEVWYEPRATARHLKGGSAGEVRSVRLNTAFHYGMYRFYRKFRASEHPPMANLIVYFGIAAKLVVSIISAGLRGPARFRMRRYRG